MDQSPTTPQTDPSGQPEEQLAQYAQPTGVGMLSPDGLWRWDGSAWVPTGAAGPAALAARAPVKDARPLVPWVIGGLMLSIVTKVILLVAAAGRLDIVNRALNGGGVSESEATSSDDFVRLAAFLEIAVIVVTAVVFLMWLHRVVANNHALGLRRLRFSPGWAVGWWFVPFANLVRPYQVMVENWKATDLSAPESESYQPPSGPTPALVVAWWFSLLAGYVLGRIVNAFQSGDGLQQLHDATITVIIATVVTLIAAVLCALVVWQLTARQEALVAKLRGSAAAA